MEKIMNDLVKTEDMSINLPSIGVGKINQPALAKVNAGLPELEEKTRYFGGQNSQSSLTMMSLTMLNGHAPMRLMRQVMAEGEKRKMALVEAQHSHALAVEEINILIDNENRTVVEDAELRMKQIQLSSMEDKINGSVKDLANLINAYEAIKAKNGIEDWDEVAFEKEEKQFHVRRGFELMYRNLLDGSRAQTATIEYMQQYGVHPQVGLAEVSGYIAFINTKLAEGVIPHGNDLEEFLDRMAEKYTPGVDETMMRIFGTTDISDTDFMTKMAKN
jgi:hypothetical protein